MAITDNTKKKLPDEEGLGAGFGVPGGVVAPASRAPKVMHSPSQPGLEPPAQPKPMTAFSAGQGARDAIGATVGAGVKAFDTLTGPLRRQMDAGVQFARGLYGLEPASPSAVGTTAPIGAAQAAPRAPVVQPPAAASAGEPGNASPVPVAAPALARAPAPTAAPAAPAPSPVVGQFNGRDITAQAANDVAARLPIVAPGAAPVAGPGAGFAFAPPGSLQGAAAASAPAQTVLEVPRFVPPSVNTGRVAAAERERAALAKQLDGQISAMASRPSGLNSIGERQLYAQLIAQRTGLTEQVGQLAGQAAGAQAGVDTQAGVAGMDQVGANARALLNESGANTRTQIQESGANARNAATLNAPETFTDANGNVVRMHGNSFTPVTGPQGEALQAPRTRAEGAITPAVQLDALVKQLQAEQGALQPDPARIAALQQQINGLAFNQPSAGTAPPPLQTFLAEARKANPGVSDAELTSFYQQKYGR